MWAILVMHDNDLSFCHIHRTYSNPHPENRFILDCVSNFVSAVSASLKLGTVRLCRFPVEFRLDVFKFLFDGKGTTSSGIAGKLYNRGEFDSKYFPEGWSTVCDKLGDSCEIEFPVQMDIHIKYGPKCYFKDSKGSFSMKPRSFFEEVIVTISKNRC